VLTNGSIYMDLVQLSAGQQLLLSLPDEPTDLITEDAWIGGLRQTFAPGSAVADDELAALWRLNAHEDGHRMLPRTIRYIEDRQREERRYTGPIETHPSRLGVVWGKLDPIAVYAMAERLVGSRPGTPLITLDGVGHYPMLEAPDRFAAAVLELLDG
jgi:pimeloyl-ACP methyl ester carboxylesterase